MKKVIVTGANGFIGTALCRELALNGIQVIAVLRDENENIDDLKDLDGIRIVYCDLMNFRNLAELISDRDVEVLYHLAWVGSAGKLRGDIDVQINNIKYTCDTIKACADMKCKRFVFAASIMEYEIEALMQTDASPNISTLYSGAKISADYMARTLAAGVGVEYIRAVISNIYGAGEKSQRLVITSLKKLLKGEHCSFSKGEQMYDFIYITDAAKAFAAIGEKGYPNRTYYIGSLKPRPLKEFLTEMGEQVSKEIKLGIGDLEFNGVSLSYQEFDVEAVKKDTGFEPSVTFAEGIKKTINWLKEQKDV